MDVVGAIMAIIVSSPVMLLMCILIKLTSPGYLYTGKDVSDFIIRISGCTNSVLWKSAGGPKKKAWTVKNDPRVTGIGKFMRR